MGSGVSTLTNQLNNNNIKEEVQNIIIPLFINSFNKYQILGVNEKDFENEIRDILTQCEPKIIEALKKHEENNNNNSNSNSNNNSNSNPNNNSNNISVQDACETITNVITSKNVMTFMCCVDGSETADIAFKTMMHLRRKFDNIILFHAFCNEKEKSLPAAYRSHFIRERYESQLIPVLPSSKYSFLWEERLNDLTAFDVLNNVLQLYQDENNSPMLPTSRLPDFIVLGFTGRKGPKEISTTMGNTVKLILNKIPISCIICKTIPSNHLCHKYIYAIGHSESCKSGYHNLMKLIYPRDKLEIIYCLKEEDNNNQNRNNKNNIQNLENIQKYYEHEFQFSGPKECIFTTLYTVGNMSIKERIVEYVNNHEEIVDFFVLTPKITVNTISSMTEYLIQETKTSIILVR